MSWEKTEKIIGRIVDVDCKKMFIKVEYSRPKNETDFETVTKTIGICGCKSFERAVKVDPVAFKQQLFSATDDSQDTNQLLKLIIFDYMENDLQRLSFLETINYSEYLTTHLIGKYIDCEVMNGFGGYTKMETVLKIYKQ